MLCFLMGIPALHLYLDDSGTRYPDHPSTKRKDGLDHFALGGFLIGSEKVKEAERIHHDLLEKYNLTCPLHSSSIRSKKYDFRWMEDDQERARNFLEDLYQSICVLPAHAIACVIHRPGYNDRYKSVYGAKRWLLCKTAYILSSSNEQRSWRGGRTGSSSFMLSNAERLRTERFDPTTRTYGRRGLDSILSGQASTDQ